MKFLKQQFVFFACIMLAAGAVGCSDEKDPVTPIDPTNPPLSVVPLIQFEVSLGDQTTSGTINSRSDIDEFNRPKTTFAATDHFIFSYSNATQKTQKAYVYMFDSKTWTVHEEENANSPIKTIQLNVELPTLSATYLSTAAIDAGADKDGMVVKNGTGEEKLIGCFDALHATAEITMDNTKATAKVPFKHINHLLNFYIRGTITENTIQYLELSITYTDVANKQQKAILQTSSRASYADIDGTEHTVLQAIIPRNAVVTGIRAVKNDNSIIISQDPDMDNIDCPEGKSHLITLNINDNIMSVQIGSLINDWAFGGEMNPDGSPVGNIYIETADQLRGFSESVNIDPSKPAAQINGVLAYTAHVIQTADIDLSSLAWRPIGGNLYQDSEGDYEIAHFAGTYNGNGYKISGMTVTASTASSYSSTAYAGMFGKVQSPAEGYAILTNIQLVNVNIQLNNSIDDIYGGALAAHVYAPQGKKQVVISQCSAQGTINVANQGGRITVGGLVGEAIRTHITGSSSEVSVTTNASAYSYAGGIVGRLNSSSIASGYAKKAVSGESRNGASLAGGIAGELSSPNEYSFILACSSEGDVSSKGNEAASGGVAGYNEGNITGCYAKGNATSTGNKPKNGAIIGSGITSDVNLCYATGVVGAGTSNLLAKSNNIVYQINPAAGSILSTVSGKAWRDANGSEMAEATIGGILTTIPINTGGKLVQEVKARLWILSDESVWTTAGPASSIYPLPASNYKGQ